MGAPHNFAVSFVIFIAEICSSDKRVQVGWGRDEKSYFGCWRRIWNKNKYETIYVELFWQLIERNPLCVQWLRYQKSA